MAAVNAKGILIRKKTLGANDLVDKIVNEPESAEGKLYLLAKKINESALKRGYVESSLLASDNLEDISNLLEIPPEVIEMYRTVFYDVQELDKLSKLELLSVSDKNEASMKMWALSQGLSFVAWRLGRKVDVSPIEGLQDLFTTCMYKAKEAMFSGNTSESSKESTKWVKLALDIARLLKLWVLDSAAAKKDIELALKEVIPDFNGLDDLLKENDDILAAARKEEALQDVASPDSEFESLEDLDK